MVSSQVNVIERRRWAPIIETKDGEASADNKDLRPRPQIRLTGFREVLADNDADEQPGGTSLTSTDNPIPGGYEFDSDQAYHSSLQA
ncbi:hypothetical protein HGRIS_000400 [Hohenbuehelia grisea]|uniref:Uncharacterized protein n=1 Tax=Hohenbuehelia grisea TaxID=104357 RepID=A0ABR3JS40_9AGAR